MVKRDKLFHFVWLVMDRPPEKWLSGSDKKKIKLKKLKIDWVVNQDHILKRHISEEYFQTLQPTNHFSRDVLEKTDDVYAQNTFATAANERKRLI